MIVLGIHDGIDAGAAVVKNGKILSAINEERLSRIKLHHGCFNSFPTKSIEACIKNAKIKTKDIDAVCIAGVVHLPLPLRILSYYNILLKEKTLEKRIKKKFLSSLTYKYWLRKESSSLLGTISKKGLRPLYQRYLQSLGINSKNIFFIDHHLTHSYSALIPSNLKNALVITLDGHGDGLSGSVGVYNEGNYELISKLESKNSIGWFYTAVTYCLGFQMSRHEGKVTGLAAYGNPKKCYKQIKDLVWVEDLKLKTKFDSKFEWIRFIEKTLKKHKKEDVAAAAQNVLEENVCSLVKNAIKKTGIQNVALAGGVFANVKLNQRINELKETNTIFIFPHMTDGGLAAGAALAYFKPQPYLLKDVFLGPKYEDKIIKRVLLKERMSFKFHKDIEKEIASLLAKGKVIAHFYGRMEFGPRALGNRSIFYKATDPSVNDWLNKKLRRTEFMPFAPITLKEYANKCYKHLKGAEQSAKFMTLSFDCTDWMKKRCLGAVHVDGTARPQIISREDNKRVYNFLKEYYNLTKIPSLVNTSFNMHEEPIVCNPEEAVAAFKEAGLDYLAIGNYLVSKE